MVINNNRFLSIKYSFRKYSIGIVSSIYIYMYIYIIHCLTKITFKLERCSVVYIYIIYIYIYIYIGSILIPKSSDIMTSSSLFSGPSAAAAGISLVSRWYLDAKIQRHYAVGWHWTEFKDSKSSGTGEARTEKTEGGTLPLIHSFLLWIKLPPPPLTRSRSRSRVTSLTTKRANKVSYAAMKMKLKFHI